MRITGCKRALDKIYKRRDRFEIPDWQRGEVWSTSKKQQLIDSILRGWRLPKFYFVKYEDDEYEVVDGQQRLVAIYEFFSNELPLSDETSADFGGPLYRDLKPRHSDSFDDFEIDYDEIVDASEEELKKFFQRLQQGLPLRSSEKLNAVHSKLRDYCKKQAQHIFLSERVSVANTRFAHFDIITKVAAVEIEGLDAPLRFDDLKAVFESQASFSANSAIGKRIRNALDFLELAFPTSEPTLKSRAVVQTITTFACKLIETGRAKGLEATFSNFVISFLKELAHQVELGQGATDYDYIRFQRSVNANVRGSAKVRHEILLRKAFVFSPELADAFDSTAIKASGISARVEFLGESIAEHIRRLNSAYSFKHGKDLFKSTNKTTQALLSIRRPVNNYEDYTSLIDKSLFLISRKLRNKAG